MTFAIGSRGQDAATAFGTDAAYKLWTHVVGSEAWQKVEYRGVSRIHDAADVRAFARSPPSDHLRPRSAHSPNAWFTYFNNRDWDNADAANTFSMAALNQRAREPYLSCTSPLDECLSRADCKPWGWPLSNGDHRTCGSGAVCGQPFLIGEAPRFADVLGAPADLVEACSGALIDETAYAKLCFAFASAYAGTKLGPSKLDMSHCFDDTSLVSVTKLVIAEGGIGETVAALEALERPIQS